MLNFGDIYALSELSQASYATISGSTIEAQLASLKEADELGSDKLGSIQADILLGLNGFRALHHLPNDVYGFSGTLFEGRLSQGVVLAIRGSEGTLLDFLPISGANPDRHQANADIILPARGIARDQLVSLFNYYRRLITPASQEVSLYRLVDTATRPESGSYYTYESRISELLPPTTRYVHLVFEHSEIEGAKRFG